jgi:hypothetical protein
MTRLIIRAKLTIIHIPPGTPNRLQVTRSNTAKTGSSLSLGIASVTQPQIKNTSQGIKNKNKQRNHFNPFYYLNRIPIGTIAMPRMKNNRINHNGRRFFSNIMWHIATNTIEIPKAPEKIQRIIRSRSIAVSYETAY